ncbi:hypothetical protein [Catenuloplanes indicus]|uniref:Uncharacterized protein n=1 Tax=Catenuloplanes indicus TaxID=137267 RepID=A0AAE4B1L3_9ACTN|nr:hypothetical protein [Catenuloplanes indicus]MDQ0371565.1 hypothetical protein [Catenuloplanes indicus]
MIRTYRKRPVEVQAVEWTGDNEGEIYDWSGGNFRAVDVEDRGDDPDITGEVYDRLHSTWVGVKAGHSIVRGVQGEFYPIAADVLAETYEPVPTA